MPAVMAAVVPRATGAAAFESRTPTIRATAIGRTAAAIVPATVPPAAAERTLETRARVAADACGVTREFFTGSRWAANSRGAGFAGEQDDVLFDDCGFCYRPSRRRGDNFFFDMLDFDVIGFEML
jgi:hypothetical protein